MSMAAKEGATDDAVWRALANPHRRALLDAMRDGPRTTGELAEALPELSRFAVMQHLGVLVDAGLVLTRKDGRHRHHFLNAVPIQDAYERWVPALSRGAAATATALRRYLESENPTMTTAVQPETDRSFRLVQFRNSITIAAPRERVFEAFVHEQHSWYPYNYGGERVRSIVFEPFVGGRCFEDWGDHAGQLYSFVWHYDPPSRVCLRGFLANGVNLENWFALTDNDDGTTTLEQTLNASGALNDDDAAGIRQHGDMTLHADALRAYLNCA
jgi:DNA-binding transcriptional ArsR family regulator